MVLTHTTTHTYSYPFSTVTLAFFLRYLSPTLNPFATHVLSTDTIESRVDPATGRLYTTRVHLKKSRMPAAVFKLLPASMTGGAKSDSPGVTGGGDRASYILETSVVDIKEGWMQTESRNLNWTGVLSVVEQQHYNIPSPLSAAGASGAAAAQLPTTDVATTVIFRSRLGDRFRGRMASATPAEQSQPQSATPAPAPAVQEARPLPSPEGGWFSGLIGGWGAVGIQRSIETLASKKTKDGLVKSREGMKVVMERLRSSGGVTGVLELMRIEKQGQFAP